MSMNDSKQGGHAGKPEDPVDYDALPLPVRFSHGQQFRSSSPPRLESGLVVGDFRLVEMIGEGGMGQVWQAEQISLGDRPVALKFVRPERVSSVQLEFFRREARAGGRLNHPGIVAMHGYGEEGPLAWIGMEYVPGAWTLHDSISEMDAKEKLPLDYDKHVAKLVADVADAMQAAHDAGVIHRDLKPRNILITPDDRPKVTDFGLARITDESAVSQTGEIAGSYFYMSPEQVAAKRAGLDHRTDIFSLGATFYELLTLRRAFSGDSALDISRKILFEQPVAPRVVRPGIPAALEEICLRALEKQPAHRFQTMREFAQALREFVGDQPVRIPASASLGRGDSTWLKRASWTGAGLLGVAVVLLFQTNYPDDLMVPAANAAPLDSPGPHPWSLEYSQYAELQAYAQDRILEAEQRLAKRVKESKSSRLKARLSSLIIPAVAINGVGSLNEALQAIPELEEFNLFLEPQLVSRQLDDQYDYSLDLQFPILATDLLDLLMDGWWPEVSWRVESETIAFRLNGELRDPLAVRTYPVWDLLTIPYRSREQVEDSAAPADSAAQLFDIYDLAVLIQENVSPSTWEYDASIDTYGGRIVIAQRPAIHEEIDAFLVALRRLVFSAEPPIATYWRNGPNLNESESEHLARVVALEIPASLELPCYLLGNDTVPKLELATGIDVVVSAELLEDCGEEELRLIRTPGETICSLLDGNAELSDCLNWSFRHGVLLIHLSQDSRRYRPPVEGRMYPVWDLMLSNHGKSDKQGPGGGPSSSLFAPGDSLGELVRSNVSPESWDADPVCSVMITPQGVMVVNQSEGVQDEIGALLRNLRETR